MSELAQRDEVTCPGIYVTSSETVRNSDLKPTRLQGLLVKPPTSAPGANGQMGRVTPTSTESGVGYDPGTSSGHTRAVWLQR